MPNPLTGDFDLVAQFSLPCVDAVLGSIHAKGDVSNDGITFLHSFRAEIPPQQSSSLPIGKGGIPIPILNEVQGIIEVQVSTPTVTLVNGSSTRATVHYEIMAHYIADDPSSSVPEFIHGELQVTCSITQNAMSSQSSLLSINIDAADLEVDFIPDPGSPLSAQDLTLITGQIKSFLKTGFQPVNATLPNGIDYLRFKALPGGTPAVALLISLTNAVLSANAADSVTKTILQGSDDFAVAISSDCVLKMLEPMKQQIESTPPQNLSSCGGSATIASPKFSAQLENTGLIAITITATGTFHWIFGTDALSITILQYLQLSLIEATQTFALSAPSDPTVTIQGLPLYTVTAENDLKAQFIAQRDAAINQAQAQINNEIKNSLNLNGILGSAFNTASTPYYKSLQVSADGLVLHGTLTMVNPAPVDVEVDVTADNANFTALHSWIPAGTIQQYTWSWLVPTQTYPFHEMKQLVDSQKFIFPIPAGFPPDPSTVCLEVAGTQGPWSQAVVADSTCSIGSFGPSIPVLIPKWWDKLAVGVLGLPDPASQDPGAAVGLVAHLDAQATADLQANVAVPTLVYFADAQVGESMNTLSRTITSIREKESALSIILILPSGSLERLQIQELAELRSIAAESPVALAFTEDYEGTWAQSLHVEKLPSTHLLSPTGKLVWQQDGTLDAAKLTAAIEAQLVRGSRLTWTPLRSFPAVGALAPDFLFDLAAGEKIALRRLQGRRIMLNFWTTWSSPSVEQLRRLQRLQDQSTQDDVVIVAVNDGEKPDNAEEFFRKNGFTMHFVPDEYRQIARLYRIRCWPTTVTINEHGKITRTQFGVA